MSLDLSALLKQDPDKIILVIVLVIVLSVASLLGSMIALWRTRERAKAAEHAKRLAIQERREQARSESRKARDEILTNLLESNKRFADAVEQSRNAYEKAIDRSNTVINDNATALRTLNTGIGERFTQASSERGESTKEITNHIDARFDKIDPTLLKISNDVSVIALQVGQVHALVEGAKTDLRNLQMQNTDEIKLKVGSVIEQVSKLDISANDLLELVKQISSTMQALKNQPVIPVLPTQSIAKEGTS